MMHCLWGSEFYNLFAPLSSCDKRFCCSFCINRMLVYFANCPLTSLFQIVDQLKQASKIDNLQQVGGVQGCVRLALRVDYESNSILDGVY